MSDPIRSWSYGYDTGRHQTSYTDAAGKHYSYGYSGNDLTQITDPAAG
jgi:hypothetical protein